MELEFTRSGAQSARGTGSAEERLTVLVVDDDVMHLRLMELVRDFLMITIYTAESADMALIALKSGAFDAVLMDCRMPGMDGFECVKRWRQMEAEGRRNRIPIIAVTGITDPDIRERCGSAGMDACITKPFALEELQDALKQLSKTK